MTNLHTTMINIIIMISRTATDATTAAITQPEHTQRDTRKVR